MSWDHFISAFFLFVYHEEEEEEKKLMKNKMKADIKLVFNNSLNYEKNNLIRDSLIKYWCDNISNQKDLTIVIKNLACIQIELQNCSC